MPDGCLQVDISCGRPTQSRLSVVFIRLRLNINLMHKLNISPHVSHACFWILGYYQDVTTTQSINIIIKIPPKCRSANTRIKIRQEHSNCLTSFLCCVRKTIPHFPPLHARNFPVFYLASKQTIPDGRAGTAWEPLVK